MIEHSHSWLKDTEDWEVTSKVTMLLLHLPNFLTVSFNSLPRMDVFMPLVINVIHYNSSFLDEDIVSGIVRLANEKHLNFIL